MSLPKDPFILLSYVNTQLRDNYSTLEELCGSLGVSMSDVEDALGAIGFSYNTEDNQFKMQ